MTGDTILKWDLDKESANHLDKMFDDPFAWKEFEDTFKTGQCLQYTTIRNSSFMNIKNLICRKNELVEKGITHVKDLMNVMGGFLSVGDFK